MASGKPVLLKIGGSVLTEKSKPRTLRRAVAKRLASEIAKAELPTVVIHGAGSFGHPEAKAAKLGVEPVVPARRSGVSGTLASVMALHSHLIDALQEAGLRPISVPLHALAYSSDGVVQQWPLEYIKNLLADGFTPVLHGTVIRDDELGWRILSGDEIVSELAGELDPRLILFLSDVDGIMDMQGPEPKLLTNVSSIDELHFEENGTLDVTGGMANKVQHALMASQCAPTLLGNGLERGRTFDLLRGKAVPATRFSEG